MSERPSRPAVAALEKAYLETLDAYIKVGMHYLAARGIPGNEWIFPWAVELSRSIPRNPTMYQLPWSHPARVELEEAYGKAYQEHLEAWHALSKSRAEEQNDE